MMRRSVEDGERILAEALAAMRERGDTHDATVPGTR